jgi:hypothetical protein
MLIDSPVVLPTLPYGAELDRLGDEIAELSAHLTPPPRACSR